jgi:amino acid adenylation domain-containing protein
VLDLPVDHARPPVQSHDGATMVLTVDPELTAHLRRLARSEGVTLYMLMLSAFSVLLTSLAGQEEVVVGSPMAGRSQAAWAGVIGDFVNMVAVRLHSDPQQPFRDLLAHARQQILGALDHQEFPFALLVERLMAGRRDPSRSPIFQVSFDLQRLQRFGPLAPLFLPYQPDAQVDMAGLTLAPYFFPQQEGQFDLGLQLAEADDQIIGALKYSTALFAPATIERMQAAYIAILRKVVADPTLTLSQVSVAVEAQSLGSLLNRLHSFDIKLWVDGGKLRVNAPAGRLNAQLQGEIARHKDAIIARLQQAANSPVAASLAVSAGSVAHPLSFAQQRIWFLDQMAPGSAAYNLPILLALSGPLQLETLQRSLGEIMRRHEILRTHLDIIGEQANQVVDAAQTIALPVIELDQVVTETDRAETVRAEALRLARAHGSTPIDLAAGPLLRATLLRLGVQEHWLVLTSHRIACDEASAGLLCGELAALYAAFAEGKPSPLAPLPMQYAGFAAWQRLPDQSQPIQEELGWWTRKLAGPLPILDLPTDSPRPPFTSTRGARRTWSVDPSVAAALRALSREEGVSVQTALLAIFNTLLHRTARQDDIIVGLSVPGRSAQTAGLIGPFANTLALRTDLSGAPDFRQLLRRVETVMQEALDHQNAPFDRLLEALNPPRDPSRFPIFQVVFNFDDGAQMCWEAGGVEMRCESIDLQTARFDLVFSVQQREDAIDIAVEYCTDLFEDRTIGRMVDHFMTLLGAVLADREQPISQLPLLSAAERRLLLSEWNATQAAYPHHLPVHRLFEQQAAATPAAIAAGCAGSQISYGELNRRANRLARHLQALGVQENSLAGIYMQRSIDMIVALLAVHKAGAAYLPLDPAFPADRLAFMIEDSQTRIIIADSELTGHMPSHHAQVVVLDQAAGDAAGAGSGGASENLPDAPGQTYDGERLAYVLYTSGSTGRPKGVQVPQRALVNFLASMQQRPGITQADTLLSVTTLSFDIAGLEIFLPLISGARVEIAEQAVTADGPALLGLLQRCGASIMQATPATWRLLLGAGWEGTAGLKVLCGGEAMPGELAGQLLSRCDSLWNMYGPTETTIWSTLHHVTAGEGIMPIGRPIANTQVYILDAAGQPTPTGVAGELYIGGDGVAHGYLNRPELTAEKFVPDPFAGGNARLYRTGDLARYRPDGNLDFLGRIDFQVKVRGFRIELGEIEAILEQHPSIRQAVVIAREDTPGDVRLVAYLSAGAATVPPPADLRAWLKEKLPDYMVPAHYITLEAFPLTPNGKVDRKALPAPAAAVAGQASAHFIAPRNDVERQVAAIWQTVLNVQSVGIADNFFDLGGHSLLIIQVHTQLRRTFDTDLTVAQMFQYPTVEALAAHLQRPHAAVTHLQQAQERAARQRAQFQKPARTGR